MKHLILALSLIVGLSSPSFNDFAYAQETAVPIGSQSTPINATEQDSNKENQATSGEFKFDVDIDLEESDIDKLEKVANVVGSVFGDDFGKELSGEFKTLSESEKEQLVSAIEGGFNFESSHSESSSTKLVEVIAILAFFSFPIILVMVLARSGQKKRNQKMELVTMYLQADKDLPPHVINAFEKGGSDSSLKSGLVLSAVGLGLVVALNVSGNTDAAAFGFIPLFIGLARLVFWYFEERKYLDTYAKNEQQ